MEFLFKLMKKCYTNEFSDKTFQNEDFTNKIYIFLEFVREMNKQKKIVSAFCHGPWVLISAGIIKGKKIAGYVGIKDDINNAGAIYTDKPAVIDGNIITASHPRDVGDLMKAIIARFK